MQILHARGCPPSRCQVGQHPLQQLCSKRPSCLSSPSEAKKPLTKADNIKNVGRRHRIDYRGPNLEVMSFRAEDSGSTGVSRSNVHLKESQDDGNTELHHGAPGQQSQAGDTVLGDLA